MVTGELTALNESEIVTIKPAEVSVMPKGIEAKLTPDQMRQQQEMMRRMRERGQDPNKNKQPQPNQGGAKISLAPGGNITLI